MTDNINSPRFFITNNRLYLKCGKDDFSEITILRIRIPRREPMYFNVWATDSNVYIGPSFEAPVFQSTISSDGFLDNEIPDEFMHRWLGPKVRLTMNEAISDVVEEHIQDGGSSEEHLAINEAISQAIKKRVQEMFGVGFSGFDFSFDDADSKKINIEEND